MKIDLKLSSPALREDIVFALVARGLLDVTIALNRLHIRLYGAPPLYESGVRYRLEPHGEEYIADIPTIQELGWGDCAMLIAWRIAELQEQGEPAAAVQIKGTRLPDGKRLFHARVRRADGRIEDPSIRLGMWSGEGVSISDLPLRRG